MKFSILYKKYLISRGIDKIKLFTSISGKIVDSADDTDEICGLSLKKNVDPDPEIEQPVLGIYLGI